MKKFFILVSILATLSFSVFSQNLKWGGKIRFRTTANNTYANEYNVNLQTSRYSTWTDMRINLFSTLELKDGVALYGDLEIKDITFGDPSTGGSIGTDGRLNFALKNAYMNIKDVKSIPFDIKLGLMPIYDNAHGLIIDTDAAGIQFVPKFFPKVTMAYLKYYDYKDVPAQANKDGDIYMIDFTDNHKFSDKNDLKFSLGAIFLHDASYMYHEQSGDEGKPAYDFYLLSSFLINYNNALLDAAIVYDKGYDFRNRKHDGFAISIKPSYTLNSGIGQFKFSGTYLAITASDDKKTYQTESGVIDYNRKYVKELSYYTPIYQAEYYTNGLELLGQGINDRANVREIMNHAIDLGQYGQLNYVGRIDYMPTEKLSLWFAGGYVSRYAKKYIAAENKFVRQAIGTEFDLGTSYKFTDKLIFSFVAGMMTPSEDYFGKKLYGTEVFGKKQILGFNSVLKYSF